MPASTTMTIRIRPDVREKLDRIAADTQRSKSFLAGEAVAAYVDRELEIIEGIKRAMADAEAGRVVPHEQAMAEVYAIIEAAKKTDKRGGSACLDSAPLVLSGFLPGLSNAGPGDFVAAEGGRSPTAAATKSWRGYAAATNACTPK